MPILTDLDRFRLELGDINADTPLFNDDEANYFIEKQPDSLLLAVADACDALAVRFAAEFDFSEDGQSVKRMERSKLYAQRAASLRARSARDAGGRTGTAGAPWHPSTGEATFTRGQFNIPG